MKFTRFLGLLVCIFASLQGFGQFNPSNPPEPNEPVKTYRLTTKVVPSDASSTSSSTRDVAPGTKVTVNVSLNSSFTFLRWEENGTTISTSRSFTYEMPARNVELTAICSYNPSNPSEPSVPVEYGEIKITVNPSSAGYSSSAGKYVVGSTRSVSVTTYRDYKFRNWTCDGEVLSTSSSFNYVVKKGINNLVANFDYDPSSPGEPNQAVVSKKLTIKVSPSGAGYTNPASGNSYPIGSKVDLNAMTYQGYRFKSWTLESTGETLSTSSSFSFTMPEVNTTVVANYEYTPSNPGEPGTPSPKRNVIYGGRLSATQASEVFFDVNLENVDLIYGLNIDVAFPDGFIPDYSRVSLTNRTTGFTLSHQNVDEKTERFFIRGTTPIAGGSGAVMRIPVKIPADAPYGESYTVMLSKGVMVDNGSVQTVVEAVDGIIKITDETIGLPDSPDFVITSVTAPNADLMPDDSFEAKWTVGNAGNIDAAGGWSEMIYLINESGRSRHLSTIYYSSDRLGVGETVERSATLAIPDLPGLDGRLDLQVILVPDVAAGEIYEKQLNNTASTSGMPINLGKRLVLELPATMDEGSTATYRASLSRSGDWSEAQTFTIKKTSGDNRLEFPETVTILRDQSAAYFLLKVADNEEVDDSPTFILKVEGGGYEPVEGSLEIIDDEFPAIEMEFSSDDILEGETFSLTLTLPKPASEDITISLSCDTPARFSFPATVTVPRGNSSVTVEITAVDNDKIESTADVTFRATAPKYEMAEDFVILRDNDMPVLEMELTPAEVSESAGPKAIRGTLRRISNTDKEVTVLFSDNKAGNLIYDNRLTMKKGVTEIDFTIGVVDNAIKEGDRDIEFTASVYLQGCSCSATKESGGQVSSIISIIDDDGASIALKADNTTLRRDARKSTVTVIRNTPSTKELTVDINVSPQGLLTVPASVTIPAGSSSTTLEIIAPESAFTGEEKSITINATAEEHAKGTLYLLLSDRLLPDATVTLGSTDKEEYMPGETITVKSVVANAGNAPMPDAVPVDLYLGKQTKASAFAHTSGTLQPGDSEEVVITFKAPDVPGSYSLKAHVNDANNFQELTRTNNTSDAAEFKVVSPFTPSLQVASGVFNPGDKVKVTGSAPRYSSELEIYYITDNVRFTQKVVPDADGNFSTEIIPEVGGQYIVGVCIPGEDLKSEMGRFTTRGMKLEGKNIIQVDIPVGSRMSERFRIVNLSNEPLTGLAVKSADLPQGCSLSVDCPSEIGANSNAEATLTFTAQQVTDGYDWEEARIIFGTSEGLEITRPLYFYGRSNKANLVAGVSSINTTMAMDKPRTYRLTIGNNGKEETGTVVLSLPAFMQSGTQSTLSSIGPNESVEIDIVMTPTSRMQLNVPVTGQIGINCANGDGLAIPYTVEPVSSETGRLIVDVKDEFTFYTEEAPHVEGADVLLSHPVSGKLIASGKTGTDGKWSVEVPAGYYTIDVSATKHGAERGVVQVAPGTDTNYPIFIPYDAISYSWEVEETTVDDTYDIVSTVEFETRVPKPVVVVDFPEIPYRNGIVYITARNEGLITAKNPTLILPDPDEAFTLEPLGDTWAPELRPGESIRFPVKVTVPYDDLFKSSKPIVVEGLRSGSSDNGESRGVLKANRIYIPAGCFQGTTTVSHDEEKCDSETGKMVKTGNVITAEANYFYGDCSSPQLTDGITGGMGFGGGGGGGGLPGAPGGGGKTTTKADTKYADRLREILITGCLSDCEKALADAIKACLDALGSCTGMDPSLGWWHDLINCGNNVHDNCSDIGSFYDSLGCGGAVAGCIPPLGCPAAIFDCIRQAYNAFHECLLKKKNKKKVRSRAAAKYGIELLDEDDDEELTDEELDALDKRVMALLLVVEKMELERDNLKNLLGEGGWSRLSQKELGDMLSGVTGHCDTDGYIIRDEALMKLKPLSVDTETFNRFIERFNNLVTWEKTGVESDNMVDVEAYKANQNRAEEILEEGRKLGYPSFKAMAETASDEFAHLEELMEQPSEGVCATITLEFKQTLVLTRQAFRGKLTITNGNKDVAMEDIKLQLKIRDEEGNLAGEKEFAISAETLDGFSGPLDLTSGWQLGAGSTGAVTVLFIPSKYAAPVSPKVYSFGGILSYVDPFSGLEVSRELSPIDMTVSPSPLLGLDYFLQRDVMGDDPMTPDRIEKSENAEFALLIRNKGFGDASDLRMTTHQPKIVENQKGLAIDFAIVGTSLNGKDTNVAIGETVPTEFGDLEAGKSVYAQWWLKSSLMGHFISYDVKANQVSAYGSEDMSLLDHVDIHELIRGITPEDSKLGSRAFVVNDISDTENLPDMMYFSDATAEETISKASEASIREIGENTYEVTIGGTPGWLYAKIDGLWNGDRKVESIVRQSDSAELPADNFWCTYVTLNNSAQPVYEDKLHAVVKSDGSVETYIVKLEPKPEIELMVVAYEGIPAEGEFAVSQIKEISVTFNKAVEPETFTPSLISLSCQGKRLSTDDITVTPVGDDNTTFVVSFGNATDKDGYYVMMIDLSLIKDAEGFFGESQDRASWMQYSDGLTEISISIVPADGGTVSPSTGRYEIGKPVKFKATPAEGYEFAGWSVSEETVSSDAEYTLTPSSEVRLTATFRPTKHLVEINYDSEKGTVSGASTGIYEYGTQLELLAEPKANYKFVEWQDESGNSQSVNNPYTHEVKGTTALYAVFDRETGVTTMTDGFNCMIWPNPVRSNLHIEGDFTKLEKLELIDTDASRVKIYKGIEAGGTLNVESLSPGIYILRIFTEKGVSTHKLIKCN